MTTDSRLGRWGLPAVISLAVILVVGGLMLTANRHVSQFRGELTHSEAFQLELAATLDSLSSAEIDARRLVTDADPTVRERLTQESAAARRHLDAAGQLTRGRAAAAAFETAHTAVAARLAVLAQSAQLAATGSAEAAATALGTDSSTLEAVQQIHAITQSEERALALERDDLTRQVTTLAMASLGVLLVVAILAIFGLAEASRRGTALHSANQALGDEIAAVKTLEAARAATEQRFELLVKGVADYALYMLDPEGRITSWNTGAERIKGYKAEEIIGEHFSRFYTPEDRAAGLPKHVLETALREGKFEAEAWRVRKDGTRFLANVVVDPLYDDNGEHIGFAKITRDVTERRMRERSQREAEQRFQLFVRGVVDYALYMLDPEGNITSWNTGAERIKGYKAEEILGQHFSRFYTDEDRERGAPKVALETALREGKFEAEAYRVRKDGTHFLASVVLDPLYDENGKHIGFAKITRDITERRRQQEVLEQTRDSLAQAQKMEALGQLTGGIAHDFNNMLAIILGALNIMQRRLARGEMHIASLIESAIEGAQRGAALTQRLLAFARKQALAPTRVDPNRLISGMSDMIRRALGEQVQTEVILGGGAWPIQVDTHQLETAIINLVVNARDAMTGSGRLTIETSNAHLDDDYARRHSEVQPGQYVMISISDTGSGISPEMLQKVFDPFFTTKRTGTGLGLSQVYGFVKQSGGHISVYSEIDKGTTVRLYLPRDTQPPTDLKKESDHSMPRAKPGESILVVEDEDAVRALSVEGLRELGYTVLQAEGGERALTLLHDHPEVGLLFTDVVMPNMNGRQLAEEARRGRPALKVLYTTGYAQNAIVHAGRLDAGVRLLSKPFMIDALARAVRDAFDAA